jgi:hypothetical protein
MQFSARDVLEAYAGGDHVDGQELRAAVAVILAAWDGVKEAAGDATFVPAGKARDRMVDRMMRALLEWDTEIAELELDVSSVVALPALINRRRDHPRLCPGPME